MKKSNLIMMVVTIVVFIVLLLGATYAYFASNTNVGNGLDMTITTDNNNIAFAATEGTLSMHVKAEDMLQSQTGSGDVLAAETVGEDNIVITLSTNTETSIMCTYNVYFEWNANQVYTKTTGATKELTLELNLNDEDANGSEGTNSFAEEKQITDVVTGTTKTKVVNGAYIVGSSSNSGTQEWIPTVRFYNLAKDQSALAGKNFGGKFTIEDVECGALRNLSDLIISKEDSEYAYASSQTGGGFYKMIYETSKKKIALEETEYGTISINLKGTYEYEENGVSYTNEIDSDVTGIQNYSSGQFMISEYYEGVNSGNITVSVLVKENGLYEVCTSDAHSNGVLLNDKTLTLDYDPTYSRLDHYNYPFKCSDTLELKTSDVIAYNYGFGESIETTFALYKIEEYSAGYRYEGANPDNYVTFNGEDAGWRIIGTFEGSTIGLEPGKQYTKIIRNSSLGTYKYDEGDYMNNLFNQTSLGLYLNGEYLNSLIDKDKIAQYNGRYSNWYYGAVPESSEIPASTWYDQERKGDQKLSMAIGLINVSDYYYSTYSDSCDNSMHVTCPSAAWLKTPQWTLNPFIFEGEVVPSNMFFVQSDATIGTLHKYYETSAVYPVLYLDHTVKVIGGTGTQEDPFIFN